MLSTHLGTRNWNEKNPKIQNSFLGLSDAEFSARSMRIDNALGAALMNDDLNAPRSLQRVLVSVLMPDSLVMVSLYSQPL